MRRYSCSSITASAPAAAQSISTELGSTQLRDGLIAQLYELLVEGSIAHEFARFDARKPG